MVCCDEGSVQCIIFNLMPDATQKKLTLLVRPSYTVSRLFEDIKQQLDVDNFDILMQPARNSAEVRITESENRTLSDIGIDFSSRENRATLKLVEGSSDMTQDGEIEQFTVKQRRSAIVSTSEADSTVPNQPDDDESALNAWANFTETKSSPIPLPPSGDGPSSYHPKTYYPSRRK